MCSPKVLGTDILWDKKATCYPGFEDTRGATFVDSPVKDDNVITSRSGHALTLC